MKAQIKKRIEQYGIEIAKLEAVLQERREQIAQSLVELKLSAANLSHYATELATRESQIASAKAVLAELQIFNALGQL